MDLVFRRLSKLGLIEICWIEPIEWKFGHECFWKSFVDRFWPWFADKLRDFCIFFLLFYFSLIA